MTKMHERQIAHDPFTGVQIRIGVMGSAGALSVEQLCVSLPSASTRRFQCRKGVSLMDKPLAPPHRAYTSSSLIWRTALYGLALNGVWEYAQCPFLYVMPTTGFWQSTLLMSAAIFGDVVITLGVCFLSYLAAGRRSLIPPDRYDWLSLLGTGFVAGVVLEWTARALGHWSYTSLMPTLSVLGVTVGFVPVAQITLLPALSLRLATWPGRFR